jgi:hypothetical protein
MSTGAGAGGPAIDPTQYVNVAAPGRECGTCTLCCKVYEVPSLSKPSGKWCQHCTPGTGCGIWATRPDHCRSFYCLWMTDTVFTPEWKPERSRFVMTVDPFSRYLNVQVDPGHAKAWRQEPYYGGLKRMAAALLREERLVVILNGLHATILTPNGEVELGVMTPEDRVQLKLRVTPNGPVYDILKNRVPVVTG